MRQNKFSWKMEFRWNHIETFFMFQTIIKKNRTFTFKLFLRKSKFSWLIYDSSNNVNYVVCCLQKDRPRYCWQNRICYCKKSLNVKVYSCFYTPAPWRGRGVYCFTSVRLWLNIRSLSSIVAEKNVTKNVHICSMCIKTN
jgi:hypothetical protein